MKPQRILVYFRRDLRLFDQTALNRALATGSEVIPVFIFDPRQTSTHAYRSERAFSFLLEAVNLLQDQLESIGSRFLVEEGLPHEVLLKLSKDYHCHSIYFNRDYTPFSLKRDGAIRSAAEDQGLMVKIFDDALLNPPEQCVKQNGDPYTVFTPFYKNASGFPVPTPNPLPTRANFISADLLPDPRPLLAKLGHGGHPSSLVCHPRESGSMLEDLTDLGSYELQRNMPALKGTSRLSPFLKFGCVSVRDVFHRLQARFGPGNALSRQLYWRDFYSHIAYHFPHVFGSAFKKQYDSIKWHEDRSALERWQTGMTGFPIVDAGMRELNQTGIMHNRTRMITASFLVKDLLVDWREGEAYFARQLMDYDPSVNNGNWQWAASTGCDAQPYFRIFNPWLQQKKFDPEAVYIKRWIPELRHYAAQDIHAHDKHSLSGYPLPMVDHGLQSSLAKARFREAASDPQ